MAKFLNLHFRNSFTQCVVSLTIYVQWVESGDVEVVYALLSRQEYSWLELQEKPLPPGVDPARIEQYLSTNTFQVNNNIFFFLLMPQCLNVPSLLAHLIFFPTAIIINRRGYFKLDNPSPPRNSKHDPCKNPSPLRGRR